MKPRGLRRDLLVRLMLPLLALVVATGAIGAWAAQRLSDRVFDGWLLDAARSLAHQVAIEHGRASVDLPGVAESILAYDESDRTYYSVTQHGRHVAGQRDIPTHGEREASYGAGRLYDARFAGAPVRVAAVRVADAESDVEVRIAETLKKRHRAQRELLVLLLPMGLPLVAAAIAIMLAVSMTLRPLEAIAARWDAQSHASLQPIAAHDVPRELLPFANALNALLARIRALLARERQFAATAAHQLRTPLAGLQLGLARAADMPDLAATRQVLGELQTTTQRTARLVQQLLALSRIDPEASADLGFVECDLVALARDVGETFVEMALAHAIDLELVAPASPVTALAHPELLSEALGNLLDNALRYTPRGGRVAIEFDTDPPAIRVSDSGPGIAPDERDAVFERFVRGRDARGDGSGLGLAIVREIAALHGATVSLSRSPALGGACLAIRFGAAAAAQAAPQGSAATAR